MRKKQASKNSIDTPRIVLNGGVSGGVNDPGQKPGQTVMIHNLQVPGSSSAGPYWGGSNLPSEQASTLPPIWGDPASAGIPAGGSGAQGASCPDCGALLGGLSSHTTSCSHESLYQQGLQGWSPLDRAMAGNPFQAAPTPPRIDRGTTLRGDIGMEPTPPKKIPRWALGETWFCIGLLVGLLSPAFLEKLAHLFPKVFQWLR